MANIIMLNGVAYSSTPSSASAVPYSNTTSGLSSLTVQGTIDELANTSIRGKSGTNANTCLTNGVYSSASWTNAASGFGNLLTFGLGNYITQYFNDAVYGTNSIRRSNDGGSTWNAWNTQNIMKAYNGATSYASTLPVNTQTNVPITLPSSYSTILAIIPWGYSPSGTYATPLYFRGVDTNAGTIACYPAGSNVQTYQIAYTVLYY